MANNVVKKINEFNSRFIERFEKDVVIIRKLKNKKENISLIFIVVPIEEYEIKDILFTKTLPDNTKQFLINKELIKSENSIKSCLYCGNLEKFTEYEQLVYKYPLRKIDIREGKEPEYRLYTRTKQYQDNFRGNFNLCNNSKKSWKSVIEKCGSKFGLILKIILEN